MRSFTYGFLRGLALPIYLLVGLLDGLRLGLAEWRKDNMALREIWVRNPETPDGR